MQGFRFGVFEQAGGGGVERGKFNYAGVSFDSLPVAEKCLRMSHFLSY